MLKCLVSFVLGVVATVALTPDIKPLDPCFPPAGTQYTVIAGTDEGYVLKFDCPVSTFKEWYVGHRR